MATLTPLPKVQFTDINGAPLVGGKLYSYLAGTTTPTPTYTDAGQGTPNTNPVILDSRGEAGVWLATGVSYKLRLTTATDIDVWTVDNIINNVPVFGSGTAANPAVVSSSQTNTGIYFPGSSLAISLLGTEYYRFTTTGAGLGAGITAPASIIQARAASNSHFLVRDGNSFGAGAGVMVDAQDSALSAAQNLYLRGAYFSFGTGAGVTYTERIKCGTNGNFGINTTVLTDPAEKLQVNGNVRVDGGNSVLINNSNNSNTYSFINTGVAGAGNAQLEIVQSGSGARVRINNSGQMDLLAGSGSLRVGGGITRFASTAQAMSAGSARTVVSHGGPRVPDIFSVVIRRNSTAGVVGSVDASYATNDEVIINTYIINGSLAIASWASSTQIGYEQYLNPPNIAYKNSPNNAPISPTLWGLVFYAIWL